MLKESERVGMLRQDIIAADATTFPDMKPAAVTKAVSRDLNSRYLASKPEGKATRYWLRLYSPKEAG